ncbi:MAG: ribonuclease H-like domain-containing protein [bacterium]|nr:ribonuclease H-like domain-containing protein [bacterium]
MPGSSQTLADKLAMLGTVARSPAARTAGWDGPAFEVRRNRRDAGEFFGREQPHPADASALFLDTETTGLAGGTGTTPFLVGLAFVAGGEVVTEQYFLRRLSGEAAMLDALRERLAAVETLVTFNGRRFDWPILEARGIINRTPLEAPPEHHDLIGAARRLWHRPLGTYRLSVIERQALGICRVDDVDAAQIPGLYLDYLRTGDAASLEPVFEHNRHDVLCLLHLRRKVRRWVEDGVDPPQPVDWEGLGVLRLRAAAAALDGDTLGRALTGDAENALRRALEPEDDPAVRWRIASRLAPLLRRAARWEELLALWEHEVGGRGIWRIRALLETAKTYDRRIRRPDRALKILEEACGLVEWLLLRGDPVAAELDLRVRRRMMRLSRRLEAR